MGHKWKGQELLNIVFFFIKSNWTECRTIDLFSPGRFQGCEEISHLALVFSQAFSFSHEDIGCGLLELSYLRILSTNFTQIIKLVCVMQSFMVLLLKLASKIFIIIWAVKIFLLEMNHLYVFPEILFSCFLDFWQIIQTCGFSLVWTTLCSLIPPWLAKLFWQIHYVS